MRVIGTLAMIAIGGGFFCWLMWWLDGGGDRRAERKERERQFKAERRAGQIETQAVRLLDRALVDPMYRQSAEWEDQAKALVDGYYGKGLKP